MISIFPLSGVRSRPCALFPKSSLLERKQHPLFFLALQAAADISFLTNGQNVSLNAQFLIRIQIKTHQAENQDSFARKQSSFIHFFVPLPQLPFGWLTYDKNMDTNWNTFSYRSSGWWAGLDPKDLLKSSDMDSVQVRKAVFVKESYTTLGGEPRTFSYLGR